MVHGPEEVIDGILVTDVHLHIFDLTVYDLIVGAVDGIELDSINLSPLGVPTVNFDHRVFMPLIETHEIHTDPGFAELAKEGEHLIGTVLRAGEWMAAGAAHYLLKPVEPERLAAALAKVRATPAADASALEQIFVRDGPRYLFLPMREISL